LILRILSCSIAILFSSQLHFALAAEVFFIPESQLNFRVYEGSQQDKPIQVYGLLNNTEIKFLSSRLSSKDSAGYIESNNIKFNNTSSLKIYINKGEIKNIMVSVKPHKAGVFTGDVILQNNKNDTIQSIPINVEVIPFWPYNILVFIIGFGASWIFWSWNRKKALEQRFTDIKKSAWELERKLYAFVEYLKEYYSYLILYRIYYKDLVREVGSSNVKDAEKIIEDLMQALSKLIEKDNFDDSKLSENAAALNLEPDAFIKSIISHVSVFGTTGGRPLSIENQDIQDAKFSYWKYLKNRKPSIFLLNASAILLGILIGLGTLFQQQQTNVVYSFDWRNIIFLLALGGGADSIKQLVERTFYKET
jgi:hypothetical protein